MLGLEVKDYKALTMHSKAIESKGYLNFFKVTEVIKVFMLSIAKLC
jgi:hypothetical protein